MRKTFWGPAAVALAAIVSLTGAAAAHDYSATTASTIDYQEDEGAFGGRVGSTHPECEAKRRVRLRKHLSSGFEVVGRTRTDGDGRWSIEKPKADGTYSVVVRRRIETSNEHDHSCRRGGSAATTVNPR